MRIPVVFCSDDNYIYYLCIAITSLKESGSETLYDIYILTESLSENSVRVLMGLKDEYTEINIINISNNLKNIENLYSSLHISRAMYYRLLIPEVLSQYKKVIYLDCDLVVLDKLNSLYDTDIGDAYIAGAVDLPGYELKRYVNDSLGLDCYGYINSGVLLINCEAFKNDNIAEKMFDALRLNKNFLYPDQDLLNMICHKHIHYIDGVWNAQAFKVGGGRIISRM